MEAQHKSLKKLIECFGSGKAVYVIGKEDFCLYFLNKMPPKKGDKLLNFRVDRLNGPWHLKTDRDYQTEVVSLHNEYLIRPHSFRKIRLYSYVW